MPDTRFPLHGSLLSHATLLHQKPLEKQYIIYRASAGAHDFLNCILLFQINNIRGLYATVPFFPLKNRVVRSEAWTTKDLAGVRDLGPGLSSRFVDGEASWILFVTDENENQKSLESRAKKVAESIADEKLFAVEAAGKRLVGFVAVAEAWNEKSRKTATAQVKELKAAASKTN